MALELVDNTPPNSPDADTLYEAFNKVNAAIAAVNAIDQSSIASDDCINLVDNGCFDIWQRGSLVTAPAGANRYGADRWKMNGAAAMFMQKAGTFTANGRGAVSFGRQAGEPTAAGWIGFGQPLGAGDDDVVKLNGKYLIVSAWVYRNTGWTGVGANLIGRFQFGTGVNEPYSLGAYATGGTLVDIAKPISSVPQRVVWGPVAVPAGTREAGIAFYYNFQTPAPAADNIYMEQIQLESVGPGVTVPRPYQYRPVAVEKLIAQRLYHQDVFGACGVNITVNQMLLGIKHPVDMRTIPTTTMLISNVGASAPGVVLAPAASLGAVNAGVDYCRVIVQGWSGLTVGSGAVFGTSGAIGFSAEL